MKKQKNYTDLVFGQRNYWEEVRKAAINSVNRPKKIKSARHLLELAIDYFQAVDNSPWQIHELLKSGERAGEVVSKPAVTPYTWAGFSAHLIKYGILASRALDQYRTNGYGEGGYEEYQPVIVWIDEQMRTQKFAGASIGVFNPHLIAKEIGLTERQELTVKHEQPLFADVEEEDEDYGEDS